MTDLPQLFWAMTAGILAGTIGVVLSLCVLGLFYAFRSPEKYCGRRDWTAWERCTRLATADRLEAAGYPRQAQAWRGMT